MYSFVCSRFFIWGFSWKGLVLDVCHSCVGSSLTKILCYTLFPLLASWDIAWRAMCKLSPTFLFTDTYSSQRVVLIIIPICSIFFLECLNCPSPNMWCILKPLAWYCNHSLKSTDFKSLLLIETHRLTFIVSARHIIFLRSAYYVQQFSIKAQDVYILEYTVLVCELFIKSALLLKSARVPV